MGRHHYESLGHRARHMSIIISDLPCTSEVRSAYYLDSYYDCHASKHRLEREDGDLCCGGGGNWGHEWNCTRLRAGQSAWPTSGGVTIRHRDIAWSIRL